MSGVAFVAGQRYVIIIVLINIAWELLTFFWDQKKPIRLLSYSTMIMLYLNNSALTLINQET